MRMDGEREPSECQLSGGCVPGAHHTFPWVGRRRAQVRHITCGLFPWSEAWPGGGPRVWAAGAGGGQAGGADRGSVSVAPERALPWDQT